MAVIPVSSTTADLPVGGLWQTSFAVVDFDGVAVDVAPTVTVTLPGGTTATPTVEQVATGGFVVNYLVAAAGRYVARVVSDYGVAAFAAYATAVVTAAAMPDLDSCRDYLKLDAGDTSQDDDITSALAAESSDQRSKCRIPAAYPDSLREALHRRVARNLALRGLPLAVLRGDGDAGDTILPGRDPEVKRLEAPHRRVPMG